MKTLTKLSPEAEAKLGHCLSFHWGTSRGRDTYGYAICTLKDNGEKAGQCNGGGYDMQGTSLAEWMTEAFQPDLVKLGKKYGVSIWGVQSKSSLPEGPKARKVYGLRLTLDEGKYSAGLDGGCGMSSMQHILKLIGLRLAYRPTGRKSGVYIVERMED